MQLAATIFSLLSEILCSRDLPLRPGEVKDSWKTVYHPQTDLGLLETRKIKTHKSRECAHWQDIILKTPVCLTENPTQCVRTAKVELKTLLKSQHPFKLPQAGTSSWE